jgi:hypothetical protein
MNVRLQNLIPESLINGTEEEDTRGFKSKYGNTGVVQILLI